ncbi:hypothetical protein KLU848_2955 [Kluyveromyces marxianus]
MLRRMSDLIGEFSSFQISPLSSKIAEGTCPTEAKFNAHSNSEIDSSTQYNPGRRNHEPTKPITIDNATGEVLVRKTTGKAKVRKGQSAEEYQEQLRQYFIEEQGPTKTEEGHLVINDFEKSMKDDNLNFTLKQDRQRMISYAEKFYYNRDYLDCLKVSETLLTAFEPFNKKNKMLRELEELKYMIEKSKSKVVDYPSK